MKLMARPSQIKMITGCYEKDIMRAIAYLVESGDIAYDIGSHIGYSSLLMARNCGHRGFVHCFEMMPSIADVCKETLEINNLKNSTIHNVGISDHHHKLKVAMNDDLFLGSLYPAYDISKKKTFREENCKLVDLDTFVYSNNIELPVMIKMDIEGAECEAIIGAKKLLTIADQYLLLNSMATKNYLKV